jgi:integrase
MAEMTDAERAAGRARLEKAGAAARAKATSPAELAQIDAMLARQMRQYLPPEPAQIPQPAPPAPVAQVQAEIKKQKKAPKKPSERIKKPVEERHHTSKKLTLSRLPENWRERVFSATESDRKEISGLRISTAILWATGCRPDEIERGIRIILKDNMIHIKIYGSKVGVIDNGKVKAERGLEWRIISLNKNLNSATVLLAELAAGKPVFRFSFKEDSLRKQLHRLGGEVLKRMKNPPAISAYSYRHAMGADLKSCDTLTDIQRAMVLGHRSVESMSAYGSRRRGGKGVSPIAQVAAAAVPHGQRQRGGAPGEGGQAEAPSGPKG